MYNNNIQIVKRKHDDIELEECQKCQGSFENLYEHYGNCDKLDIKCPLNCLKDLKRDEIEIHINTECPNTEYCKHRENGCSGERFTKSKLERHNADTNHTPFEIIERKNIEIMQLQESIRNKDAIILDQNRVIKEYEDHNDAAFITIQRKNIEILELQESIRNKDAIILTQNRKIKEYEVHNETFSNPNQQYKNRWIIEKFSEKKEIPFQKGINSLKFYIDNSSFHLMLCPHGDEVVDHTSIYICVDTIGGGYKQINLNFIYSLLNHKDPSKNKTDSINLDHDDSGYYAGENSFILFNELTNENGWISDDDQLFIEFQIQINNRPPKPLKSKKVVGKMV